MTLDPTIPSIDYIVRFENAIYQYNKAVRLNHSKFKQMLAYNKLDQLRLNFSIAYPEYYLEHYA